MMTRRSMRGRGTAHRCARTAAALLTAAALTAGLGACTSSAKHQSPPATAAPSVHAVKALPKSVFHGLESFTGPAVAKYGLPAVQGAYEEMVNFIFETGWSNALIRKDAATLSRADFAVARSYMTPSFRKAFDATFAKVVQADKAATAKLEHAAFFGVIGPNGARPVPGVQVVTDRRFTKGTAEVDKSQGFDRLAISFRARANIQLQDAAGKHYALPAIRILKYWLVPNTGAAKKDRPFLIDSWAIRLTESPATSAK